MKIDITFTIEAENAAETANMPLALRNMREYVAKLVATGAIAAEPPVRWLLKFPDHHTEVPPDAAVHAVAPVAGSDGPIDQ